MRGVSCQGEGRMVGGESARVPRVSVCIPAYDNARFLADAIESVLGQSFVDFELLIIDDRSPDSTAEIAVSYAERDCRIRFLANERNLGMVENWNRCLREARGEYIKYVFGDDLLNSPDTLGKMVEELDRDRETVLVASSRFVIDSDSRMVSTKSYFAHDLVCEGTAIINLSLLEHNNIIGEPSVVMFRRELAARGFDPRYRQIVDLEMWFHILERGRFAFIAEPLCSFREHVEQQTRKNQREIVHVDDYVLLCRDYLVKGYIPLGPLAKWLLLYYQLYNVWNRARHGNGSRELALEKIDRYCGKMRFFLSLPLYKVYNPFFKLIKRAARNRFQMPR